MMNLLNPTTLQQQLDIYSIKTRVEAFLHQHEAGSYVDNFLRVITEVAPDIAVSVQTDIYNRAGCFDLQSQHGLNSYLRMFYLSLPLDTTPIREYIVDTNYGDWVRYFVNILLLSYIEFYRGYHNEH